jgi:hypothetical protein
VALLAVVIVAAGSPMPPPAAGAAQVHLDLSGPLGVVRTAAGGVAAVATATWRMLGSVSAAWASGVPSAPTNVTATAGNAQATVSWTEVEADPAVTGYTVTSTDHNGIAGPPATTDGATSVVVTGLTNNSTYTFRVTATNAEGTSEPSAPSNAVTPVLPPPDVTTARVIAQSNALDVRWHPPHQSSPGGPVASIRVSTPNG